MTVEKPATMSWARRWAGRRLPLSFLRACVPAIIGVDGGCSFHRPAGPVPPVPAGCARCNQTENMLVGDPW